MKSILVLLLFLQLAAFVRGSSLVCPNGQGPSRTQQDVCFEFSAEGCCSAAQGIAISTWLNSVMNRTMFPDCWQALRKVACGTNCSMYAGYYHSSVADSGDLLCNNECAELNQICAPAGYSQACHNTANNADCYPKRPAKAAEIEEADANSTPLGFIDLPFSLSSAMGIGILAGATVLICVCVFCCAARSMKGTPGTSTEPKSAAQLSWERRKRRELAKLSDNAAFRKPTSSSASNFAGVNPGGAGIKSPGPKPVSLVTGDDGDEEGYDPCILYTLEMRRQARTLALYLSLISVLPLVQGCFIFYMPAFFESMEWHDEYGRIYDLQLAVYIGCLVLFIINTFGFAAGRQFAKANQSRMFMFKVYIGACILGLAASGWQGYLAFDQSYGHRIGWTRSKDSPLVEDGSAAGYTFVCCVWAVIQTAVGMGISCKIIGMDEGRTPQERSLFHGLADPDAMARALLALRQSVNAKEPIKVAPAPIPAFQKVQSSALLAAAASVPRFRTESVTATQPDSDDEVEEKTQALERDYGSASKQRSSSNSSSGASSAASSSSALLNAGVNQNARSNANMSPKHTPRGGSFKFNSGYRPRGSSITEEEEEEEDDGIETIHVPAVGTIPEEDEVTSSTRPSRRSGSRT